MKHKNINFVISTVLFGAVFVSVASAAPSVKRLGTSNATVAAKTTNLPTKASTNARTGSIRATKVASVKPVTVTKPATVNNADADQRLSIGKYIHTTGVNTGVIKPIASTESVSAASNDIVILTDRVSELETTVGQKQNVLTPLNVTNSGDGPVVTSVDANNGEVVVSKGEITIPVGEPMSTNRASIWVE